MSNHLALVIEDEADLAKIFSLALESAGFSPEIICTGDGARELLAEVVPEVAILDLRLPRVDGDELLRQIRADARLAGTRVIVATADPLMAQTLQGAADLVLIKPISFSQLRDLAKQLRG